jgi:AcrR family transcriptional regulator
MKTAVASSRRPRYGEGRQALLEAAIRVIASRGLRGLTYRAVAAEAGVTHGLVQHHFGSRDAMIHEALAYSAEESIDVSSLEPRTGHLEDLARNLAGMVADNPEKPAFEYELALEARRRPELADYVREMYATYIAAAQRELQRAGLDADPALSRLVFAALDGLVFQQLVISGPKDTQASVDRLHEMLAALREARAADTATARSSRSTKVAKESPVGQEIGAGPRARRGKKQGLPATS